MSTDIHVLVGTTKGAFILDGGADWAVKGPFCDGWPINHVLGDPETGTIWAAGGGDWHGAGVWRSTDGGANWSLAKLANGKMDEWLAADPAMAEKIGAEPSPPAPYTGTLTALWSLGVGQGVVYAGGKPATLYESRDGGQSFTPVTGLSDHPTAASWEPGAAGLILHSILADPDNPQRLFVGISAAGFFASEDGGRTWERRVRLSNADSPHGEAGETWLCVHNIARAADGAIYQQNHHGVFRSPDEGRAWQDITQGLSSAFGFPVAAHPRDPATAHVFPLNGDTQGRYPPDAAAAVWRTRDAGATWQPMRNGLPQNGRFFTVLRQSMATDRAHPAGVYFGTNSGSVFLSPDEGDSWQEIARHLPTVLSVETLMTAR